MRRLRSAQRVRKPRLHFYWKAWGRGHQLRSKSGILHPGQLATCFLGGRGGSVSLVWRTATEKGYMAEECRAPRCSRLGMGCPYGWYLVCCHNSIRHGSLLSWPIGNIRRLGIEHRVFALCRKRLWIHYG